MTLFIFRCTVSSYGLTETGESTNTWLHLPSMIFIYLSLSLFFYLVAGMLPDVRLFGL